MWLSAVRKWGLGILAVAVFALQISCSMKENPNAKVTVKNVPDSPIVIDANRTIGSITLNKAWFAVSFRLKNASSKPFVVRAVKMKITSPTKGGVNVGETTVIPDEAGAIFFADLQPGEEGYTNVTNYKRGGVFPCPDGSYSANCAYDPAQLQWMYIGGNPGKPATDTFSYTVEAEIIGWFYGDNGEPTDRLSKNVFFTTN